MSRINEIQKAILQLEGGAFHKLFDQYLYKKYRWDNIQPFGIQSGTNKSTRGIPDSYVCVEDKYILICYGTVKNRQFEKIKKDVTDCIDMAKTCLQSEKIEKIICGHIAEKISIEQLEELKALTNGIELELIGIGTLSQDLSLYYPNLAYDHLGIPIDTHQFYDIDDFIKAHDVSGINAPIDTKFAFREQELKDISDSLLNNTITILSGSSGVGKTRLAVEVCKHYECEGWTVFCIKSNGVLLYPDIHNYLTNQEKCLLFLDDANEVTSLNNVIEQILEIGVSEIKMLLTVRDYAKGVICRELSESHAFNVVEIGVFSNDEIRSILIKNYNIQNQLYLDRIVSVADGNIRLAILAGLRAVESGLTAINSAEDIFKCYYDPIIDKLNLGKDDMILMTIIAIMGNVRYRENEYYQQLLKQYVREIDEEDALEKLYNAELINWFKKEVVKITDQSFGNYILFYVLYEKKWIDLELLIERGIPADRNKIVYVLSTLYRLFYSEDLADYLEQCINDAWDNADETVEFNYLESFYPINPIKGLQYLKRHIISMTDKDYDLRLIDIDSKKNYNKITTKEIEILAGYKRTRFFNEATELLLVYYEKRPDLFMDFYHAITTYILFDKESHVNKYSAEIGFIKRLWDRCEEGCNYNNTLLYLHVLDQALQTEVTFTEAERGNKFTLITMKIAVCDEIKELRSFIWRTLFSLYSKSSYIERVRKLFKDVQYNHLDDKDAIEICLNDFNVIINFFDEKKEWTFEDTLIIARYKDAYSRLGIIPDDRFERINDCFEYKIFELFAKDYYGECEYDEIEQRRKEDIKKAISVFNLSDYDKTFKILNYVEKKNYKGIWNIASSITHLFSLIECDVEKYKDVLRIFLQNGAPFGNQQKRIVPFLISVMGYDETVSFVRKINFDSQDEWLRDIWANIPDKEITEIIARDFISFEEKQLRTKTPAIMPIFKMRYYYKFDRGLLIKVSDYLIKNPKTITSFFGTYFNKETATIIIEEYRDNNEMLQIIYFLAQDHLFDYDKKLFWELYKTDENKVWEKYIRNLNKNMFRDGNEKEVFKRIWHETNYSEKIDYALSILCMNKFIINDIACSVFAPENNDSDEIKKKQWILDKVNSNPYDYATINALIDIVDKIYPSWKIDLLCHYLENNNSIEGFKKIHIFPSFQTWSGSEIPLIDKKIHFLEMLKNRIRGLDYIDHQAYIESQISMLKQYKEKVEIQEYMYNEAI